MSNGTQWFSDFASGIQVLDQQHEQIFSLLRRIDSAVHRLDGEQAEHLVIELLDFAVTHNHIEDQIMLESGYPHAEAHQASHREFLEAVDSYMQQIVAGGNPFALARRVRHDITHWVETHLMIDDLHCVRYLCEQRPDIGNSQLERKSLVQ